MGELKPAMAMVGVQIAFAGVNVVYKLAADDGMSLRIIVAYRFLFATAFLLPLAFFFGRKRRPKLSWIIIFESFLCGLLGGSVSQNLYLESLALTSATFASAMANLAPPLTFILALTFRLERLNIKVLAGKAKVVGTLIGLGGAMLLTFYKGKPLHSLPTSVDLLHQNQNLLGHVALPRGHSNSRVMGALLSLAACLSNAVWLIIQAKMSEKYPCYYSSAALMCVMAAIQSVVFAMCIERDRNQWSMGWNIRLITVVYSGIVGSGVVLMAIAWCVRLKGPLYVSVFNPLMLLLVAIAGFFLLNENIYWGSVIGGILIVCGLYMVLWGKGKEVVSKITPTNQGFEESEMRADIASIAPSSSPINDNKMSSNTTNNNNKETPSMMIVIDHASNSPTL